MEATYTAQRIAGTANGWLVTEDETQNQNIVFCNADANTSADAVALIQNAVEDEDLP